MTVSGRGSSRPSELTGRPAEGARSVESNPHEQPFRSPSGARPDRRRRRRHGRARDQRRAAPALPGRGQSARSRERRDPAHELHPRRRRPDRDEHLRRQPAQALAALPRRRVRADQQRGREAGARGARSGGPRRLHRRLDRPARRPGRPAGEANRALRRAGRPARRPRNRPVHGRDVLRPRRARGRDRGGARRLEHADRRHADLRRGRRDARRRDRAPTPPRACGRSGWPRSARTTAPACTPRWPRSRRWARTAARRWPRCRTSGSPA